MSPQKVPNYSLSGSIKSLKSPSFSLPAAGVVRIIGIDPGYDRLGWAVADFVGSKRKLIDYGLITSERGLTIYERFKELDRQLTGVLLNYAPTEAAMENLFFQSNQKTVMKVAEARGVIMSALFRRDLPLFDYTPPQIKQAVTGFGRADKKAVSKMVQLELNLLTEDKLLDDTLDALAVMLTHAASRKMKLV